MGRVAWFDVLCFAGIVSLHLLHVLAHVARVVLALPERIYSSLVGDRDDFVGSKSDRPLTHFAVAWTSPRPLVTRLRGEAYARGILLDDLDLLIRWCRLHGVQCLSLYDEDGRICDAWERPGRPAHDGLRVRPLSRHSAHDAMARFAGLQADAACRGLIRVRDIDVAHLRGAVKAGHPAEEICSTDPDLLLVLGGRTLRLHGYPPWQLRLTEIVHISSYSIMPSRLSYRALSRAFGAHLRTEQRRGR